MKLSGEGITARTVRQAVEAARDYIRARNVATASYPYLAKKLGEAYVALMGAEKDIERRRNLIRLLAFGFLCYQYLLRGDDDELAAKGDI